MENENTVEHLKEARSLLAMSQEEMARKLGIGQSTYSLYESGKRKIATTLQKKIAKLLQKELKHGEKTCDVPWQPEHPSHGPIDRGFGKLLKSKREHLGLSVHAMASLLDISHSSLTNYEKGLVSIKESTKEKIYKSLDTLEKSEKTFTVQEQSIQKEEPPLQEAIITSTFPEYLKDQCTIHNLTQKVLAEKLKVTPVYISFLLNGERNLGKKLYKPLAKILGTTPEHLLTLTKNTPRVTQKKIHSEIPSVKEKTSPKELHVSYIPSTFPTNQEFEILFQLRYITEEQRQTIYRLINSMIPPSKKKGE